ncbi:MAG: hypothetical protein IJX71_01785 [Oscillospiraceae bacterium]|nr:hypothetical protein [Oscillospiraceae bacterium]
MGWPCLVPRGLCKTPVTVELYGEGVSPDGGPVAAATIAATCNWQSSGKVVRTSETQEVRISGVALFTGDICPGLPVISSGKLTVFGAQREIIRGEKARNPDGTVNYTRLEVM